MASIDSIISLQSATIENALGSARGLAGRISNFTPTNLKGADLNYRFNRPSMTKPSPLGDLLPGDTTAQTLALLNSEKEKWMDKHFPEMQACLKDKPEQWLCKILGGEDPFADSAAIFDSVWHQARDQAYRERNSLSRQTREDFSRRGFSLPAGAMVAVLRDVDEQASDAIGAVNRAEMQRVAEIKLDLLKFAEQQAIALKLGIMQSLADFYRQWLNLPQKDIEIARAKAQAYSALQGALSEYHRVELGFETLRLRAAEAKMGGDIDEDRVRVSATNNERAAALGNAVRAFGDVASAAATSQAAFVADLTGDQS